MSVASAFLLNVKGLLLRMLETLSWLFITPAQRPNLVFGFPSIPAFGCSLHTSSYALGDAQPPRLLFPAAASKLAASRRLRTSVRLSTQTAMLSLQGQGRQTSFQTNSGRRLKVGGISDIRRRIARPLHPCTRQHPRKPLAKAHTCRQLDTIQPSTITWCCSCTLREAVIMAHVCHVVPPLLPQNMISRSVRHGSGNMCVRCGFTGLSLRHR